jgi:hypothetical protein
VRRIGSVFATLVVVGGASSCQLVTGLGSLETDPNAGGASGSSVASTNPTNGSTSAGPDTSATTTGSAMASTGAGPTSAASSGSGMPELTPCSGVVDAFTLNINPVVWTITGSVSEAAGGNAVVLGPSASRLTTLASGVYAECYVTSRIVSVSDPTLNSREIAGFVDSSLTQTGEIMFFPKLLQLSTNPATTTKTLTDVPTHLGVALHAGSIFYLYRDATATGWQMLTSTPIPAWMTTTPATGTMAFTSLTSTVTATMTDYNVVPIALADLP